MVTVSNYSVSFSLTVAQLSELSRGLGDVSATPMTYNSIRGSDNIYEFK